MGYLDRSGRTDLSIVIRTLVCRHGRCTLGVGGAVVALPAYGFGVVGVGG